MGRAAGGIRGAERLNYQKGTKRIIVHNLEDQRPMNVLQLYIPLGCYLASADIFIDGKSKKW